jgi:hypothetical protein
LLIMVLLNGDTWPGTVGVLPVFMGISHHKLVLGTLASMAEYGWNIPVTLSVGGAIISGELISEDEYFEGISQHFDSEVPDEARERWQETFRNLPHAFDTMAMNRLDQGADPQEVQEQRESLRESFIFLRDTRVWTAEERFFGFSGAFWRGKLNSIDGFWFNRAVEQEG